MILKGRRKIVSDYRVDEMEDVSKLCDLINYSMLTHLENKSEIDYLTNYRNGIQPILAKTKTVRTEINNKLVTNHAQMITRTAIGYFLGTPIQYIQSGDANKQQAIDMLNKLVAYEDKASVDKEIGEFQSICGTAYRIIFTDGVFADEVPFEDRALNPATTFVVYENRIAEKPLVGVTYYNVYDNDHNFLGVRYYAYTNYGMYEFLTDDESVVSPENVTNYVDYSIGGVPIIEYPNNMWRIGDWELCIGLMDAINNLHSGRLDDIDQVVQSLLIFINADIDAEKYAEMRECGIVALTNKTMNPPEVKTVETSLDQSGMHMFAEEMEALLYALIGIPDRNNRSGGGGDTGQAVELRDGWADLEIVARNKELTFKKSEKQALRIILNILNTTMKTDLTLLDVDIKFTRNKNNNLLVKTQAYQTLLATKTLSPADCLTIVDLVSDVNEYVSRGQAFWGDGFAGKVQEDIGVEMGKANLENVKNPPKEPTKTGGK